MDVSKLSQLFHNTVKKNHIPQAVFIIKSGHNQSSHEFIQGTNTDLNDLINTASISKLYTACLTYQLLEQGQLKLTDPIHLYLEPSTIKGLHTYKKIDYTEQIQVQDLLFQTSGLPDIYEEGKTSLVKRLLAEDFYLTFEEKISLTRELSAKFEPGNSKKAHYADINFDLLTAILEQITGQTYNQLLQERICQPLQLKSTLAPAKDDSHTPPFHYKGQVLNRPLFIAASLGNGGVVSTAPELMTFLQAFWSGQLFDLSLINIKLSHPLQLTMWPIHYGGGFMSIKVSSLFFKPSQILLGHSGSTGSFAFYCPDKDIYMVGDFNQANKPVLPVRFTMQAISKL